MLTREERASAIQRLTPSMGPERSTVAAIHVSELPDSELSVLGEPFLRRFYYGSLLEDPDYYCYVYRVEGRVAGFTAFSADSAAVCRRGAWRAWPSLSAALAAGVVRRPAALGVILKTASPFRPQAPADDVRAEAMSTAVARPYRSAEFYRRTGVNVAHELYATIARTLAAKGVAVVKGFTRRSNVLVNASLAYLGWEKRGETGRSFVWTWDVRRAMEKFKWEA